MYRSLRIVGVLFLIAFSVAVAFAYPPQIESLPTAPANDACCASLSNACNAAT